jgi:RHS repeat-associated protein
LAHPADRGLGSTIALVNQSGTQTADYDYDPPGEVTVTNPASTSNAQRVNPFHYAGGTYNISSRLIKFGQRGYDADTGRFTEQDSIETLADPSRANRYEYANGNPTNYVDPTGKEAIERILTGLCIITATTLTVALVPATAVTTVVVVAAVASYATGVAFVGVRLHEIARG